MSSLEHTRRNRRIVNPQHLTHGEATLAARTITVSIILTNCFSAKEKQLYSISGPLIQFQVRDAGRNNVNGVTNLVVSL